MLLWVMRFVRRLDAVDSVYLLLTVTELHGIELQVVLCLVAAWYVAVATSGRLGRINEVTPRRARLVPGWVTVFGPANHLRM